MKLMKNVLAIKTACPAKLWPADHAGLILLDAQTALAHLYQTVQRSPAVFRINLSFAVLRL
jgi:hypothetical protein